jgi:predicted AAA+ superfamily ATPase
MLNKTDLAAPLGVSVPTITEWLNIMEITGQIILIHPFYENFGKRLVKSPKIYFVDPGLVCHVLGIRDENTLRSSPFLGPLFEGLVASEILKYRLNRGLNRGLYYFRDQQGLEVDFLIDNGNRRLILLEAKATKTPMPNMAKPLVRLATNVRKYKTTLFMVHEVSRKVDAPEVLCPGVKAVGWRQISRILTSSLKRP